MAIVENPLLGKVHGRFANAYFRVVGDRVILSSRPFYNRKKPTEKQIKQREMFKMKDKMIKEIYRDPVKRAEYSSKCKPGEVVYDLIVDAVWHELE